MSNQKSYSEKLKDPRWQKKRLEILERDNWTCQECGATTKELQVHHKIYRKDLEPWEYFDYELKTLCVDCHSGTHGISKNTLKEFFMPIATYKATPMNTEAKQKLLSLLREKCKQEEMDIVPITIELLLWFKDQLIIKLAENERYFASNSMKKSQLRIEDENHFIIEVENYLCAGSLEHERSIIMKLVSDTFHNRFMGYHVVYKEKSNDGTDILSRLRKEHLG